MRHSNDMRGYRELVEIQSGSSYRKLAATFPELENKTFQPIPEISS